MSRGVPPFVLLLMLSLLAAPVAAQQTHILVITGLSGDPAFAEEFHTWATTLLDAATDRYELPAENVTYLAEKTDADPARIDNRSTQENVEQAFADLAERAQPDDYVLVLLIGHGSYDRGESRFNLPGRDLTAKDYARLLEPLGSQQVAFVNAATASGGFIEALSGEGRTVVTATRSGGQWNATVFGGYFVEAFAGGEEESDQNKDGRVSVLEAFDYAAAEVARVYESDGRLQTEHALLDDNGDGEGSREPDPLESATDGAMARTVFISAGAGTGIAGLPDDPALRALYQERLEIQEQIEG
ncbi:MAG: C13 family peptidase, partial [Vicinamibacterales bacterium]|nr:C13 family peptidase [Vicinamibacterales bacterium]